MDHIGVQKNADGSVTIEVGGRFDFSTHAQFRAAYESDVVRGARIKVDLRKVDYLDSAALGMLLLLREQAGRTTDRIVLQVASKDVLNILKVASFDQLFDLR
ncbi:MAG: STAS domain-containing protein [Myxococcales bacterium]|nr:STAS domain-containing protein [Myxococcales bacterium]MCB9645000.1 STAS domain-containing protein [Deltaproteobacteria bacterium]